MPEETNPYIHKINLTDNEVKPFLALCQKAITLLHWELKTTEQNRLAINTPANNTTNNYEIIVEIHENEALITCFPLDNTSSEDKDKCRDYVVTFFSAIDELKAHIDAGLHMKELPHVKESGFKSFLYLIIPRKDYFFTPVLLAVNIIIFIAMVIGGGDFMNPSISFMLDWGANFSAYTLNGQAWRMLTACFLHYGIFHLLLNMYALLFVGSLLEPIIGRWRFITIYLFAGVGGNIASLYFNQLAAGAGASGAIFGLYGAFIALLTTNIIERGARNAFMGSMLLFVGYNLIYGFTQSNIDNSAHIGGLITGGVISYIFCLDFLKTIKTEKTHKQLSITGTLAVFTILFVAFTYAPADLAIYEKNRGAFVEIEDNTLTVLKNWETLSDIEKLQLISNGKNKWAECAELMDIKHYNNLPASFEDDREFLFEYSILREKQFAALAKWLQTKDADDDRNAAELNSKIDSLLNSRQAENN